MDRIRLGISACLTGASVRYDGEDKLDPYLAHTWGRWIDYVPVCPETEAGLSVPREPVDLVGPLDAPKVIGRESGRDFTALLSDWAQDRVEEIRTLDLWGFILKAKSPSCGLSVRIHGDGGTEQTGPGLFASVLTAHFPLLPVIDERTLYAPAERDLFVSRMFLTRRWRQALDRGLTRSTLIDFHTRNKLWLLAHSPENYRAMGRIVACPDGLTVEERFGAYQSELLAALAHHATPARHANVLQHVAGYFKKTLTPDEKEELHASIEAYRAGISSLAVPIALANHHARKHRQPYLATQTYLHPHPLEIRLRG